MNRRRPKAAVAPAVEWRGGVHVRGTPVWCDARTTREACFVSSAIVPEARRHRQIIATQATLALLPGAGALASKGARRALAVPYGRSFTLGDARLEIFPSGTMVGAASLHVDVGGTRVVYAGSVDPRGGRLGGAGELRVCDVLVVDATYAHPRFELPPVAEALAAVRAFVDEARGAGDTPVLLASPLALGPDLAVALAGLPLRGDRAIVEAARKLRGLGVEIPPVARLSAPPAPGEVVLWPPARRDAALVVSAPRARFALVSGWARDPEVTARLRVDRAIPFGESAGHRELLDYIVATGAGVVHLTSGGGREGDLVAALAAKGVRAQRLGPPEQLSLL
jgi:putative mRNA 3-end processing factor